MACRVATQQARLRSGFTLIELLVAITVMALLALMSWRGLEGISRTTTQNQQRGDALLTLQTVLSQWGADLDAMVTVAQTQPINWDGQLLRLTRRSTDTQTPALYVVAWTLRSDNAGAHWHRWQSPPLSTRGDWQQAWVRAAAWAQDGTLAQRGADVTLMPVESLQLYYFRNNSWNVASNASNAGTGGTGGIAGTAAAAVSAVPDGVRLVLTLPPGNGLSGLLTRDWVRPTLGGFR